MVSDESCTTICTGLTFLNVSNTRLASQCTAVCRVRHPSTWPTVALQSQTLSADATYTQASRHHLSVPLHQLSTFGCRTFSARQSLRPALSSSSFRQLLKMDFSTITSHTQHSRDAVWLHYMTLTVTLTFLLHLPSNKDCIISSLLWPKCKLHKVQFDGWQCSRLSHQLPVNLIFFLSLWRHAATAYLLYMIFIGLLLV